MQYSKIYTEQKRLFRKLVKDLRNLYDSFFKAKDVKKDTRRHGVRLDPKFFLLTSFAQAEQLCLVAYDLNVGSRTVEIVDEDTISRKYNVHKIPTRQRGLFAYVLYSNDPDNQRVSVVFRGTYDLGSAKRDLELSGPGTSTFLKDKSIILQSIKHFVAQKDQPVLNIAGHSLGGSDAQNCVALVMDEIVNNNETDNPTRRINTINIMHKNAAGVTDQTAQKANKNAVALKQKHGININQYIFHYHGDIVQQGGNATILADMDPQIVNTYMMEVEARNKASSALRSVVSKLSGIAIFSLAYEALCVHRSILLGENAVNADVKIYHNVNPEDRQKIARHLTHKLIPGLKKGKKIFSSQRKATKTTVAQAKRPDVKPERGA